MNALLFVLHFISGLIVISEALNKLERCKPLLPELTNQQRVEESLKALAWLLLALGAGGAIAVPFLISINAHNLIKTNWMRLETPTIDQALVLIGFAVLIVRTRIKEG